MIWQQPWAWLGLLAIVAPVIIHLLGLGRSPTQRFPTLRFFSVTRLAPTRRTQLHDPWLLLLRVAIVATAVAALAQPLYRSRDRERAYASSLARVVILDTSVSMQRAETGSRDSARLLAATFVADADIGVVLETAEPAQALDGAQAWLALQRQRRELVVISDFQIGALDAASVTRLPAETGVRLVRLAGTAMPFPIITESQVGNRIIRAATSRIVSGPTDYTQVAWTARARADSVEPVRVRVLSGDAERDAARTAEEASLSIGARPVPQQGVPTALGGTATRAVIIVTPEAPQRAALIASARIPRATWMLRAVSAMQSNDVLQDVSRSEVSQADDETTAGIAIAYASDARTLVWAAEAEVDGRQSLVLISNVSAASITMSALFAAVRSTVAPRVHPAELEPEQLADSVLARLSREPASELRGDVLTASNPAESDSDGRWLWLLTLILLSVEWMLRRRGSARSPEALVK